MPHTKRINTTHNSMMSETNRIYVSTNNALRSGQSHIRKPYLKRNESPNEVDTRSLLECRQRNMVGHQDKDLPYPRTQQTRHRTMAEEGEKMLYYRH